MKCAHIGDYQQYPEAEMVMLCSHSAYRCPICGFYWVCKTCGAGREFDKVQNYEPISDTVKGQIEDIFLHLENRGDL